MSDFSDKLAGVVSRQSMAARQDPELWGEIIERLSAMLGMSIAFAAQGDKQMIDTMCIGCEQQVHTEALGSAPLALLMKMRGE